MNINEDKIPIKVIFAVIATGLMSFSGVIVETATNVTFPILMNEFKINTSYVQWMTTIYLLAVSAIIPLSAFFKRSFRLKRLFLTANLLFLTGILLDVMANNFPLLLIGRVIQGIGTGIALPLMFNIILERVPQKKIGMMMGIGTLITAIAPAIGPTFGGIVAFNLGWRYIFIFLIPILLISLFLGLTSIEQKSEIQREKINIIDIIMIIVAFSGLILGINKISENIVLAIASSIIGIFCLLSLIYRSNKSDSPIIHFKIFKNISFTFHIIAFFIFQMLALGMSFLLPNYIQLVNSSSSTIAGLLVFPGATLGGLFAPFSGMILDKLGATKPILIGVSIVLLSLILFSIFGMNLSNTLICIFYIIFMIGTGLSFGNIMTDGQKKLDLSMVTDGNAIFNTLQQFAGAVGTSLVSMIVSLSQSNTNIDYAVATAQGSRNSFVVLLVLCSIQLIILYKTLSKEK